MSTAKKSTAGSSASKNAYDIVARTKAIAALTKAIEEQDKRSDALKGFHEEALAEWTGKLDAAKRAFELEDEDMTQRLKRRKVEHELEIQSHGCDAAKALLEKEGFEVIKKVALEELRARLASSEEQVTTIQGDTEDRVTKELKSEHAMELVKKDLENKAEVAQLTEQNKMLAEQIKGHKQTIADLRGDVEKTREMITAIAASSKPQVIREVKSEK